MSISHWIIVALVVLVLFGRGRISETVADFGNGVSSFRRGLAEAGDDQQKISVEEAGPSQADRPTDS